MTLDHNQNALFFRALAASVGDSFFLTGFSAEEFFINLDDTADSGEVLMALVHHLTNRVAKLPGRLLRDAEPAADENGGNTFAGVHHVIHAKNPGPRRELRTVQLGLRGHRELAPTPRTIIEPRSGGATFDSPRLQTAAVGTYTAVLPDRLFEKSGTPFRSVTCF